jgi:hypothetical protein
MLESLQEQYAQASRDLDSQRTSLAATEAVAATTPARTLSAGGILGVYPTEG